MGNSCILGISNQVTDKLRGARLPDGTIVTVQTHDYRYGTAAIRPSSPTIGDAVNTAKRLQEKLDAEYDQPIGTSGATTRHVQQVVVTFGATDVIVRPDSDIKRIRDELSRTANYCIFGAIGPYPVPELSEGEHQEDERIKSIRAEHGRKAAAMELRTLTRKTINQSPPIRLHDAERWQSNRNLYDHKVLDFVERWARLMQVYLDLGLSVADIARQTCNDANFDELTLARRVRSSLEILVASWEYGEKLDEWAVSRHLI